MFRPLYVEFKQGNIEVGNEVTYALCCFRYYFYDLAEWDVDHFYDSKYVLTQVFVGGKPIQVYDLKIIDTNRFKVKFGAPTSGYINVMIYAPSNVCLPILTPGNSATPTPTITPTPSLSASNTPTPTPTPTVTPSITPTHTVTPTITPTVTRTGTPFISPTPTPSVTASPTPTASVTPTMTASVTPTVTPTPSVTASITPTVTPTPTQTITPTVTPTVTPTISVTPSITPTASVTPTVTPTPSFTPTASVTPTITPSQTPTPSVTASITPTPSVTPTNTPTASVTPTQTITPTMTPSVTPSVTPTHSPTPTVTPTPSQAPFATLNPLDTNGSLILSNNNLSATKSTSDGIKAISRATVFMSSGKYYWESFGVYTGGSQTCESGIANAAETITVQGLGLTTNSVGGPYFGDGTCHYNNSTVLSAGAVSSGSFVGHRYDTSTGTYQITLDGTNWQTVVTGLSGTWAPAVDVSSDSSSITLNFGNSPFNYAVPAGYRPGVY